MGLESITSGAANTIADLDPTWPLVGDDVGQGDDHIRNIKKALQLTFENVSATVSGVASELAFAHKGGSVSGNAIFLFNVQVDGTFTSSGAAVFKSGVTIEGDMTVSGTIHGFATSAGEADHAKSASYAISAGHAVSASFANSAQHAISANYALSALSAQHAVSAQFALFANSASIAGLAKSASFAYSARHAVSADYALSAGTAGFATSASDAAAINGVKRKVGRVNLSTSAINWEWNPYGMSATHSATGRFAVTHRCGTTDHVLQMYSGHLGGGSGQRFILTTSRGADVDQFTRYNTSGTALNYAIADLDFTFEYSA